MATVAAAAADGRQDASPLSCCWDAIDDDDESKVRKPSLKNSGSAEMERRWFIILVQWCDFSSLSAGCGRAMAVSGMKKEEETRQKEKIVKRMRWEGAIRREMDEHVPETGDLQTYIGVSLSLSLSST